MKQELCIKIHGRVQGVFFRAQACGKARALGLTGWVRNTNDGGVEVLAQGEEMVLRDFAAWCQKGPDRAIVDHVDIKQQEPIQDFPDFSVQ